MGEGFEGFLFEGGGGGFGVRGEMGLRFGLSGFPLLLVVLPGKTTVTEVEIILELFEDAPDSKGLFRRHSERKYVRI